MDRDSDRPHVHLCIEGHFDGMLTQAEAERICREYDRERREEDRRQKKELRKKRRREMKKLRKKQQRERKELGEEKERRSGIPSAASSSSGVGLQRGSGHAEAGTARIRQSAMYSDRPRRSQGNRGQARPATNLPVEEDAGDVSSNVLRLTIDDTPRFETLSLNDSTPALDSTDGDVVHASDLGSGLPDSTFVAPSVAEEALSPRSEKRRKLEEYLREHTFDSFEDACRYLCSGERAVGRAEVAEDEAVSSPESSPDRSEARPVLALEHARAVPAQVQYYKASTEQIAQNGKDWMSEEVMVAFKKYMEGKDDLKECHYKLDELCHQCFSVENYYHIFHHFNFTVKMKTPESTDWTSKLYFAEVKEILRRKIYYCSPLEPYDNGHCYACKNQGMDDLKHPVIGAFDRGSPDTVFPYMYDTDSSDEFAAVKLEDEAEVEYIFDDELRY